MVVSSIYFYNAEVFQGGHPPISIFLVAFVVFLGTATFIVTPVILFIIKFINKYFKSTIAGSFISTLIISLFFSYLLHPIVVLFSTIGFLLFWALLVLSKKSTLKLGGIVPEFWKITLPKMTIAVGLFLILWSSLLIASNYLISKTTFCGFVFGASERADCYNELAIERGDPLLCRDGSHNTVFSCVRRAATKHQDPEICEIAKTKFNDEEVFGNCINGVAVVLLEQSLCKKIRKDTSQYDNCIEEIVAVTGEEKLCEWLDSNYSSYNQCLLNAAIRKKDETICDKMSNSFGPSRQTCINAINNF